MQKYLSKIKKKLIKSIFYYIIHKVHVQALPCFLLLELSSQSVRTLVRLCLNEKRWRNPTCPYTWDEDKGQTKDSLECQWSRHMASKELTVLSRWIESHPTIICAEMDPWTFDSICGLVCRTIIIFLLHLKCSF